MIKYKNRHKLEDISKLIKALIIFKFIKSLTQTATTTKYKQIKGGEVFNRVLKISMAGEDLIVSVTNTVLIVELINSRCSWDMEIQS